MTVQETLAARQHTHGSFQENAEASQMLKSVIKTYATQTLTKVQQEALDNICQKIARIITGSPSHADSWEDLAGYALLAQRELANVTG